MELIDAAAAMAASFTESVYAYLGTTDGVLHIWGVFVRCLGLMFFTSLAPLAYQLVPLAGRRGITPMTDVLRAYKRDFGASAYLWWPTLFWLNDSDTALCVLPALGAIAGATVAALGSSASPLLLAAAWVCLLSVDAGANGLMYPWDSFLLEAGFLAMWLPGLEASPSLRMAAQPLPLHAFAFRLLTIRLLTGFGKLKFVGTTVKDKFYIQTFNINQPMTTPVGWFTSQLLPKYAFIPLLFFMFLVEIPLPALGLLPGWPRVVSGVGIIILMLGIQATGNFGYFNVLTAIMAIPLLQWRDEPLLPRSFDTPTHAAASMALCGFMLPVAGLYWILNSWINVGWTHWPALSKMQPAWLFQGVVYILRGIAGFRIIAAYGVFPPAAAPPQRWAAVYEVSSSDDAHDTASWERCSPHYYIADKKRAPAFIAPYHPRFDHALFYESFAFGQGFLSTLAHHNPMSFTGVTPWTRLQLRLLQARSSDEDALRVLQPVPGLHAGGRIQHARMSFFNFVPTTIAHAWRTGEYYNEQPCGVHAPALSAGAAAQQLWDTWLPCGPEEYWWESVHWRRYAQLSAGVISQGEYEEAWQFLAFVRDAAADAARAEAAGAENCTTQETDGRSAPAAPSSLRQRRRSTGATPAGASSKELQQDQPELPECSTRDLMRTVAADATEAAIVAAASVPVDQDGSVAPADILRATNVRVLPRSETLLAGAAAMAATGGDVRKPLPVDAVNACLTWAHLPHVHVAVTRAYPLAARIRIRRTIARMLLPLQRALERLCWRTPPSAESLREEAAGMDDAWKERYLRLSDAIRVTAAGPRGTYSSVASPVRPSVSIDGQAYAVHVYADNDDAGWDGSMRNVVRAGMYGHWTMLAGGRAQYERATLTGHVGVVGLRLPTGFSGPGASDTIARAPLHTLFTSLQTESHGFGDMASEAGSFLLGLLHYDMFASLLTKTAVMAAQGRPSPSRQPAFMDLVPGALELLARAVVHPEVTVSVAAGDGAAELAPPLRFRKWRYRRDGEWVL